MKAEVYQDTTDIMKNWNTLIKEVENSKDVNNKLSKNLVTKLYFFKFDLLNSGGCITGNEEDCKFSAYSGKSMNPQLINKNMLTEPFDNIWLQPNSLTDNNYLDNGNYNVNGIVRIKDDGPNNLDKLIKDLGEYNNRFRQF
jgi:hypothetical protein